MNMLALVDGQPQTLPLKQVLQHHIDWRREVVRRRTEFDLAKARDRAHILEGLKIALDNLDAVIKTIRESADVDTARANLIARFKLSEIQANAILEMQLRRLAALERKKIEDEYLATIKLIAELEDILANPARISAIIKDELRELAAKYAGQRKTRVQEDSGRELTDEDLIANEDVVITVSAGATSSVSRWPRTAARHAVARGSSAHERSKRTRSLTCSSPRPTTGRCSSPTRAASSAPRCTRCPTQSRQAKGIPIINLEGVQVEPGERVLAIVTTPNFEKGHNLVMATRRGHHQEDAGRAVREACARRASGRSPSRRTTSSRGWTCPRATTTSCWRPRWAGSAASTSRRFGPWVAMRPESSASDLRAKAITSWAWA